MSPLPRSGTPYQSGPPVSSNRNTGSASAANGPRDRAARTSAAPGARPEAAGPAAAPGIQAPVASRRRPADVAIARGGRPRRLRRPRASSRAARRSAGRRRPLRPRRGRPRCRLRDRGDRRPARAARRRRRGANDRRVAARSSACVERLVRNAVLFRRWRAAPAISSPPGSPTSSTPVSSRSRRPDRDSSVAPPIVGGAHQRDVERVLEVGGADDARLAVRRAAIVRRVEAVEAEHAQAAARERARRRGAHGAEACDDDVHRSVDTDGYPLIDRRSADRLEEARCHDARLTHESVVKVAVPAACRRRSRSGGIGCAPTSRWSRAARTAARRPISPARRARVVHLDDGLALRQAQGLAARRRRGAAAPRQDPRRGLRRVRDARGEDRPDRAGTCGSWVRSTTSSASDCSRSRRGARSAGRSLSEIHFASAELR